MPIHSEDGGGGAPQEIAFVIADWAAGVANQITVVGLGAIPGLGQVGPHRFPGNRIFMVQVYQDLGGDLYNQVDLAIQINRVTGTIQLDKAPAAADFNGRIILQGSR